MNCQIEDIVSQYKICQEFRPAQPAEPLVSHDIPDRAWSKIGTDLYYIDGEVYLIMVGYYSKFLETEILPHETSHSVIQNMKWVFARQGTPSAIVSNSARQYNCHGFQSFAEKWKFQHVTINSRFSQRNGQVKNCVKIVKRLLKKVKCSRRDSPLALLKHRNTPLDGTDNYAATQMLNSRMSKSSVPTAASMLKSRVVPPLRTSRVPTEASMFKSRVVTPLRMSRVPTEVIC